MSCDSSQSSLQAYIDGELDLTGSVQLESHLETCPECTRAYREQLALRNRIRSEAPYFQAPPGLEKHVRAAIRKRERRFSLAALTRGLAIAASTAALAAAAWVFFTRPAGPAIEQEIAASHIRSLMPGHLTDVVSTDQHTVKPWFADKLDFSPNVKDLAAQGFALIGGRLDYIGGRPVASVVYQRRKHIINVFTWPAQGRASRTPSSATRNGFNLVHWVRAGFEYWAVSDLNTRELEQLAQQL